ncbi:MAG: c-type cytochrome [Magnetococcales bacterium]|nr:c-type cytochrome [Magnetococcales bacterium]
MTWLLLAIPVAFAEEQNALPKQPSMEELAARPFLDDFHGNVLLGYRIVTQTERYAARYTGNRLRCTNCHLDAGTRADAIPLTIAGMYPKWRSKNGRRNGIGLRIRECFVYSQNGIMPPENAPEVLAVAAYIHSLSYGQTIGRAPEGRGVPTLPSTGFDPNPAKGRSVYQEQCAACHGENGDGTEAAPPLWGPYSYNRGAGMNRIDKAAGFIWANMPPGGERSLSHQEVLDVAAFLKIQYRPTDPRESAFAQLVETLVRLFVPAPDAVSLVE